MSSGAKIAILVLSGSLICGLIFAIFKGQRKVKPLARSEIVNEKGIVKRAFGVEVADTSLTRAKGLMFIDKLPEDRGMLFVYEDEGNRKFWMKNTYIPLDMIFADSDGVIVGIVKNAEPQTEVARSVGKPSKYVLEINGGLTDKYGINIGDQIKFKI